MKARINTSIDGNCFSSVEWREMEDRDVFHEWWKLIIFFIILAIFAFPSSSFAYNEPPIYTSSPQGPHGGYITTSQKCWECHTIHRASSSFKLMRYSTVLYNCRYCHDPTFGVSSQYIPERGMVYGVIPQPKGGHNKGMEGERSVPGGSNLLAEDFTCSSCHSPHANPYRIISEKYWFIGDGENQKSSHLLLKDAIQSSEGYSFYGSGFCANCHNRRHRKVSGLTNHPVSLNNSYENVWCWDGYSYKMTSLANSNEGYSLYDRLNTDDKDPICQQCHEDSRDIVCPDSTQSQTSFKLGSNPKYIAFPHETENEYMVVEEGDDLCLNCHQPDQLP